MKTIHISLYMLLTFVVSGCVEPYMPNLSKYEDVFVVDGEISNLPGPYLVKLSRSYEFYKRQGLPVTGGQVKIIDDNGLEIDLVETDPGIYSTQNSPLFRGEVGRSYKLHIALGDDVYESDFETLRKSIPIDNLYWEYQVRENGERGVQLLIDTHDEANSTRYYAWYLDETWKFIVPIQVQDHPDWFVCYKYNTSTNINIGTSAKRVNDIIERQPLLFIGEGTNRIYIRYTTNVRQYALTEKSYKFFKDLKTINQNQGTLFDPIPNSLVGNVKSIKNKDILVLGYFLVAGVSEKRLFIDRSELPKEYNPTNGFDNCNTEIVIVPIEPINMAKIHLISFYRTAPEYIDSLKRLGYTEYERYKVAVGIDKDTVHMHSLNMAKSVCFNCTLSGENEVPSFWLEHVNQ